MAETSLRSFWFGLLLHHLTLHDDVTIKQIKNISLTLRRLSQCDCTFLPAEAPTFHDIIFFYFLFL